MLCYCTWEFPKIPPERSSNDQHSQQSGIVQNQTEKITSLLLLILLKIKYLGVNLMMLKASTIKIVNL